MRIHFSYNPKPKTDLGRILGKNSLRDGLIRPIYKFIKSVTKTNNKVQKPKTYNKVINNPIYGNRWHKAIDKKL